MQRSISCAVRPGVALQKRAAGWVWVWFAIVWPSATILRAISGCRATFSPMTKKVALAPCSRRSSRTLGVLAGSGPSSIVSHTSRLAAVKRVAAGPNPWDRGRMNWRKTHGSGAKNRASPGAQWCVAASAIPQALRRATMGIQGSHAARSTREVCAIRGTKGRRRWSRQIARNSRNRHHRGQVRFAWPATIVVIARSRPSGRLLRHEDGKAVVVVEDLDQPAEDRAVRLQPAGVARALPPGEGPLLGVRPRDRLDGHLGGVRGEVDSG